MGRAPPAGFISPTSSRRTWRRSISPFARGSRYWEDLFGGRKKEHALSLLDGFSDRLFDAFGDGGKRTRIDLRESLFPGARAAKGYALGTVFSIRYPRGTLKDDVLISDLRKMDALYRRMVDEIWAL